MSLLSDLQALADQLSPSDVQAGERVLGALIKVLEHQGVTVPAIDELLPEEHPARVQPPPPVVAAPQDASSLGSRLDRLEGLLGQLVGHSPAPPPSDQGQTDTGSETGAPSSEPASAPELDRP